MIYVEEKKFNRQVELLSFIANESDYNICAWLYPESSATEIAGYPITDNSAGLIPVTTYENGHVPVCTLLVPADSVSIDAFSSAKVELKKNADSLTLYKSNESNWSVATIGHEGMCLVEDDNLLTNLISSGFNASKEAPSWW